MYTGDQGESYSEPWTYRKRIVPLRTYSGKITYRRKIHRFTLKDAQRIIDKVEPPENVTPQGWVDILMKFLKESTIAMMEKLLPFLAEKDVYNLYEFIYEALSRFFNISVDSSKMEYWAVRLITDIASRFGLQVTLKK